MPLVTKGTRNASVDSFSHLFVQYLLSTYYVQSTRTQTCRGSRAALKKHMTWYLLTILILMIGPQHTTYNAILISSLCQITM